MDSGSACAVVGLRCSVDKAGDHDVLASVAGRTAAGGPSGRRIVLDDRVDQDRFGCGASRLESVRSSLDELIERAAKLCVEGVGGEISPRMRLLAYGFGFGNPLSSFFGTAGPKVRDLLDLGDGAPSAVTIDRLARDWRVYREHIGDLARGMFGDTPMAEALRTAEERLRRELADGRHSAPPILIIVSDGEPTDEGPEAVRAIAERMSRSGVMIVTCFLTDADLTEPKRLYGSPQPGWSDGARLMFDCASMRRLDRRSTRTSARPSGRSSLRPGCSPRSTIRRRSPSSRRSCSAPSLPSPPTARSACS
jgi:hypothetical protein